MEVMRIVLASNVTDDNMELMKYAVTAIICVAVVVVAVWRLGKMLKQRHKQNKPMQGQQSNYIQLNTNAMQTATGSDASGYRTFKGFLLKLDIEKQNRFIPGRNAYEMARTYGNLRSIVFRDANSLQKLLEEKAGTGEFIGSNKEKVDFGQTIGQFVDLDGRTKRETRIGIIHYGPDGAYIVPARPNEGGAFL